MGPAHWRWPTWCVHPWRGQDSTLRLSWVGALRPCRATSPLRGGAAGGGTPAVAFPLRVSHPVDTGGRQHAISNRPSPLLDLSRASVPARDLNPALAPPVGAALPKCCGRYFGSLLVGYASPCSSSPFPVTRRSLCATTPHGAVGSPGPVSVRFQPRCARRFR